jgi:hypothetical protein
MVEVARQQRWGTAQRLRCVGADGLLYVGEPPTWCDRADSVRSGFAEGGRRLRSVMSRRQRLVGSSRRTGQ